MTLGLASLSGPQLSFPVYDWDIFKKHLLLLIVLLEF